MAATATSAAASATSSAVSGHSGHSMSTDTSGDGTACKISVSLNNGEQPVSTDLE